MSFRNKGTVGPTVIVSLAPDRSGNFICDGTADDVQIQAAIDYVAASGGGSVFFRQGTYYLTATVAVTTNGVALIGTGYSSVITQPVGEDLGWLIDVTGSTFRMESLHLEGDYGNNAGTGGLRLQAAAVNSWIVNNYISHFNTYGVYADANILQMYGNYVSEANIPFFFGAADSVICNNDIGGASGAQGWVVYMSSAAYVRFIGNKCFTGDNNIMQLDSVSHSVFDGNILGPTTTQDIIYFVSAPASGQHNVFTNNVFYSSGRDGIRINDADVQNNRITDNTFDTMAGYGVNLLNGSFNVVMDNTYVGCVTGCINDAGTDTITPETLKEVTDPDSNVGDHPALVLPDTVDTTFRFQVGIPLEFQELVTAQVIVVQTDTGGPPDMQWSTTTDWGKLCAAENYNAGSDAETDQTTAVAQNELVCVDVSASLTGIAAGDLVGFTFIRRATQAGDTIDADAYYLGFRLRYV